MLQWLRFSLQAVLTIAIALIAFHEQQIWYNHKQGWLQAWNIEYAKAGDVMIGALVADQTQFLQQLTGLAEHSYKSP